MVRTIVAVLLLTCCSTPAVAGPLQKIRDMRESRQMRRMSSHDTGAPVQHAEMYSQPTHQYGHIYMASDTSSAQGVAEMQARTGTVRHFGGNHGREGVGFSTYSAEAAIQSCCFWGRIANPEIGVARGPRGWHACIRE